MTELTQNSLEGILLDMAFTINSRGETMTWRPTQLLVQPHMYKAARRILWPHNVLKHRKGARGRAMTLKWRRK